MSSKRINLTGLRFDRLVVIEFTGKASNAGRPIWKCICNCGTIKEIPSNMLLRKQAKSCGCLKFEGRPTHGLTKTPTYVTWISMKNRCRNKTKDSYSYAQKNITICERWKNSFEAFLSDMGEKPPGLSLDRIDNNKGYSPDNCRWANAKLQARNRDNTTRVIFEGKEQLLIDLCEKFNINICTVRNRLKRNWSIENALQLPVNISHRRKLNESNDS